MRETGAGPNAIARQLTKVAFYNSLDKGALLAAKPDTHPNHAQVVHSFELINHEHLDTLTDAPSAGNYLQ